MKRQNKTGTYIQSLKAAARRQAYANGVEAARLGCKANPNKPGTSAYIEWTRGNAAGGKK